MKKIAYVSLLVMPLMLSGCLSKPAKHIDPKDYEQYGLTFDYIISLVLNLCCISNAIPLPKAKSADIQ